MIADEQDYLIIPRGTYTVGLSARTFAAALPALRECGLREEFLGASVPSYDVVLGPVMIRRTLVSRHDYAEYVRESGYLTDAEREGWGWIWSDGRWTKRDGVSWRGPFAAPVDRRYSDARDVPVVQVSWNDAVSYCRWLADRTGRSFRLPREPEWEVFARLSGVPRAEAPDAHHPVSEPGELLDRMSDVVGERHRNAAGLVWEWTDDWYDAYPRGGDHRDYGTVYRVLRGGSLASLPPQRTCEYRLRKCPTARSPHYGFRLACEP